MKTLLDHVYARCIQDGDCMNWTGAAQRRGKSPTMRRPGDGRGVSLRRLMLEVATGREVPPKLVATYTCGNRECVRLEHLAAISRNALQERNDAQFDAATRLRKSHRISVKIRAWKTKLTLEQAREIRAAPGIYSEIARRYGVSQHTVGSIKRGLTWRDLSNPFARLAA